MTVGSKTWADGPFPLISAKHGGFEGVDPNKNFKGVDAMIWDMVAIHNVFIRGINTIRNQAIKVGDVGTEADKLEFCEFAAVWSLGLHEHHELEEDTVFPDIENVAGAKGIMEANVQQHEAFTAGLEKYDAFLKKVESGEEKYDGRKLVAIIDDFGNLLAEHLSDEIVTLRGLHKYPDADWEGVTKRIEKRIMKAVNEPGVKTKWFPFVLSHHHKMFENGEIQAFPKTPWFVTLILSWFYIPSKKHLWRFACCDLEGKPKELLFV